MHRTPFVQMWAVAVSESTLTMCSDLCLRQMHFYCPEQVKSLSYFTLHITPIVERQAGDLLIQFLKFLVQLVKRTEPTSTGCDPDLSITPPRRQTILLPLVFLLKKHDCL